MSLPAGSWPHDHGSRRPVFTNTKAAPEAAIVERNRLGSGDIPVHTTGVEAGGRPAGPPAGPQGAGGPPAAPGRFPASWVPAPADRAATGNRPVRPRRNSCAARLLVL